MDPIIGGLITGGASLLGNMFSSDTNAQNTQANIQAQEAMQQQTMSFNEDERARQAQTEQSFLNQSEQFNAAQTQQQEQFQQQMSNTAYQRASADMKAAGLNPMMMFGSGSAASTPSGGAASVGVPGSASASVGSPNMALSNRTSAFAGLGDVVGKVISSAKGVQDLAAGQASIDATRAQTHLANEQALKTDIEGIATGQRSGAIPDENAVKHADAVIEANKATTAANQSAINPTLRRAADQTSYGAGVVSNVGDAISSVIPGASVLAKAMRGYKSRSTSETSTDPSTGDTFNERFTY